MVIGVGLVLPMIGLVAWMCPQPIVEEQLKTLESINSRGTEPQQAKKKSAIGEGLWGFLASVKEEETTTTTSPKPSLLASLFSSVRHDDKSAATTLSPRVDLLSSLLSSAGEESTTSTTLQLTTEGITAQPSLAAFQSNTTAADVDLSDKSADEDTVTSLKVRGKTQFSEHNVFGDSRRRRLSLDPDPIDCEWNPWTEWGECSYTCGGGDTRRDRHRLVKAEHGGKQCTGPKQESKTCNEDDCPTTQPPSTTEEKKEDEAPAEEPTSAAAAAAAAPAEQEKGMSMKLILIIGGSVLALLGGVAFFIMQQEGSKRNDMRNFEEGGIEAYDDDGGYGYGAEATGDYDGEY